MAGPVFSFTRGYQKKKMQARNGAELAEDSKTCSNTGLVKGARRGLKRCLQCIIRRTNCKKSEGINEHEEKDILLRGLKDENQDDIVPLVEHLESASDDESSTSSSEESNSENGNTGSEEETGDHNCEDTTIPTSQADSGIGTEPFCPNCSSSHANESWEQVTPRKIQECFHLKLDDEGSFQCTVTGLMFEVTDKVHISYSILSWCKHDTFLQGSWKVCGPLFDIKCNNPALLKSILFPHSLCLTGHSSDLQFKIFHVKDKKNEIEHSVDFSPTHVKWNVSSLSPVGPVYQNSTEDVQHHGVVLIYKVVDCHPGLLFRVYMAVNNDSVIKDIIKAEKHSKKKSVKIDKPTPCLKKLTLGKTYRLLSESQADIIPGEIEFIDMGSLKIKSYYEVYLEHPVDFDLSLIQIDSSEKIWTSKLRECDWTNINCNDNRKGRDVNKNKKRKSSSDDYEEMGISKRSRKNADGTLCKKNILTEKQLMQLAQKMDKNWPVFAISCLDLQSQDIDQIKKEDEIVTIQIFNMLKKWKNLELDNATPSNLLFKLRNANISPEVAAILEDFDQNTEDNNTPCT
ncbi:uncharacterized protein si:dkeyp-97b10.3 isoform X3 [Callorhinchus milii]|uniref:uncharacterized protein si:dkeyp-97b10.3 isoform X3 n=1 Tax=Callorhinchus milii TaxID=7868 RepID=UPI001C3FE231|nr:uncharacterized protein si:dkeyp-97b10.3 isoform X3 [Callorhinchus milii]